MDEFVAYTSRWRISLYLVGSIAFVMVGMWMVGVVAPPPISRRASPEMVMFWGWITVVFFVVVSFAIIVTLRPSDSKGHEPEGSPVPARAK